MSRVAAAMLLLALAACGGDAGSKDPGAGSTASAPGAAVLGDAASGEGDGQGSDGPVGFGTVLGTTVTGDYVRDGGGSGAPEPGVPAPAFTCEGACGHVADCVGVDTLGPSCVSDCEEALALDPSAQQLCLGCVVPASCEEILAGGCDAECPN